MAVRRPVSSATDYGSSITTATDNGTVLEWTGSSPWDKQATSLWWEIGMAPGQPKSAFSAMGCGYWIITATASGTAPPLIGPCSWAKRETFRWWGIGTAPGRPRP